MNISIYVLLDRITVFLQAVFLILVILPLFLNVDFLIRDTSVSLLVGADALAYHLTHWNWPAHWLALLRHWQ